MLRARLLLPLLTLAACAASPPPTDAASPADRPRAVDVSRDDRVDATAADDAEAPCARPPSERPANSVCVREVRGQVLDTDGAPRVDVPVTVCGPVCWLGRTGTDGRFTVGVGDFVPTAIYSVLAHARPDHATVYVPMPDVVGPGDIITLAEPLRVPRYTATGDVIDGDAGVARAGAVTVRVPADARLELDLEDFKLGELGRRLRVAQVPVDRAPPFAREGRVQAVWALAPFAMTSTRPLGLRLPNTLNLAPGAAVDVVMMGGDILPPRSNAGRAVVAARGAVSVDGAFVETLPNEGVSQLTWVGVRAREP
ncbi:MAG: hypothetical protein U0325_10775 [Polyangiales bacterium]